MLRFIKYGSEAMLLIINGAGYSAIIVWALSLLISGNYAYSSFGSLLKHEAPIGIRLCHGRSLTPASCLRHVVLHTCYTGTRKCTSCKHLRCMEFMLRLHPMEILCVDLPEIKIIIGMTKCWSKCDECHLQVSHFF